MIGVARAEIVSGGNVRVSFRGWITPRKLPRGEAAPVTLHVAGTVQPLDGRHPAALQRVKVEFNRHGLVSTRGLPVCPRRRLLRGPRPRRRWSAAAGPWSAPATSPRTSRFRKGRRSRRSGRMLAFNSHRPRAPGAGRPRSTAPTRCRSPRCCRSPSVGRGQGGFGATLSVQMPKVGDEWGYVTGFDDDLPPPLPRIAAGRAASSPPAARRRPGSAKRPSGRRAAPTTWPAARS